MTFAESGKLIHPRHERSEPSLRELPKLPLAYAGSDPMHSEPMLYREGEEDYGQQDPPDSDEPVEGADSGRGHRRRLAPPPESLSSLPRGGPHGLLPAGRLSSAGRAAHS